MCVMFGCYWFFVFYYGAVLRGSLLFDYEVVVAAFDADY